MLISYRPPLARVFARKTSYCPTDEHCYFGPPDRDTPEYEEVHVSCTFTWDRPRAEQLCAEWSSHGRTVRLGGPAYDSPATDFVPGRYVRRGITFTTRGCPNHCSFCLVPQREGKLRELTIAPGNIVQDNNLLAASQGHWTAVMAMLAQQRAICLRGGLAARRLTVDRATDLAALQRQIAELWCACDRPADLATTVAAIRFLRTLGFPRWKLRCYVLVGTDMAAEERRCRALYRAGCIPFAQLYRSDDDDYYYYDKYSPAWRRFARTWSRPPATKAHMRGR